MKTISLLLMRTATITVCMLIFFGNVQAQSKKKQIAMLSTKLDSVVQSADSLAQLLHQETQKNASLQLEIAASEKETNEQSAELEELSKQLLAIKDSLHKERNRNAYLSEAYGLLALSQEDFKKNRGGAEVLKAKNRSSNRRQLTVPLSDESSVAEEAISDSKPAGKIKEGKDLEGQSTNKGTIENSKNKNKMGPVTLLDAKRLVVSESKLQKEAIQDYKTQIARGEIFYYFLTKTEDRYYCISRVSEYKLEVKKFGCGTYATKIAEWKRL